MMKKLLFAFLLLFPAAAFATSCPTGYSNSFAITIPAQSSLSGSLTNYPAPFIGHAELATTANGGDSQSSGTDVIFCDAASSGNLLSFELVVGTYSATTGAGVWWIDLPTVSNSVAQTIYVFVGKTSASDESCGPSGLNNCGSTIWNGYLQVHHFGTSGTLTLTDSTGNCTATNHGATAAAGPINGAASFNGSSAYIDTGCQSNPTTAGTITFKAFAYPTAWETYQRLLSNESSSSGYGLYIGYGSANGNVTCQGNYSGGNNNNNITQGTVALNAWSLFACQLQPGSNIATYIGGGKVGSGSVTSTMVNASTDLLIGEYAPGGSYYFNGSIAEVQVYNGVQSANFLKADSISWASPSSFLLFNFVRITSARYIAASGSDSNAGTSSGSPWQTIAKVNAQAWGAGGSINFNGGDTFNGTPNLNMIGSQAAPVLIGSYGTGVAIINQTSTGDGIDVEAGSEYYVIGAGNGLKIQGPGWTGTQPSITVLNGGAGIYAVATQTTNPGLRNATVEHTEVTGFWQCFFFDATASASLTGWQNLSFVGNNCHDDLNGGELNKGYGAYAPGASQTQFQNVLVFGNRFVNIPGDPQSGSGGVHGSIHTEAWAMNGQNTTSYTAVGNYSAAVGGWGAYTSGGLGGGSSSIQCASCQNYVVKGNEIGTTNSNPSFPFDGSAIDIDTNVQNFEIAYNLCYENVGPCVQAGSFSSTPLAENGTIHHNISMGDVLGNGSSSQMGSIRFYGYTHNIQVTNNDVVLPTSGVKGQPACFNFEIGSNTDLTIANNICKSSSGYPMFWAATNSNSTHIGAQTVLGNLYDASGGTLYISNDNGTAYTTVSTLAAWQGDGFETLNGELYGTVGSANFSNLAGFSPPTGGYLFNGGLSQLNFWNLTLGSGGVGAGVDPALVGYSLAWTDWHGSPMRTGFAVDAGASAYIQPAPPPSGSGPGSIIIQ